jgi:hypothetical protein
MLLLFTILLLPGLIFLFLTSYQLYLKTLTTKALGTGASSTLPEDLQGLFAQYTNEEGKTQILPLSEVQALEKERKQREEQIEDEEIENYVDGISNGRNIQFR